MLKEIAVADAYGAGFEFSSREKIRLHNNLEGYQAHELYGIKGKYTDDTQMSIAIAELVTSGIEWTSVAVAAKVVECFKRDPRKGYSKGFYSLLSEVDSGEELLSKINNGSDRNGAAIRSIPLGVIKNPAELIFKARMQAAITHSTEVAIKSSCAIALAAHFGVYQKGKLSELKTFLEQECYSGWDYEWSGEVSLKAFDTVSAAFSCLFSSRDVNDLLIKTVSLGGDTDSVAAIAVGLAACYDEYSKKLPKSLLKDFDEPKYGAKYLDALDRRLMELVAK